LGRMPPHLSFTAEEEVRGREGLRELGIPASAKFVCFHARDSAYLDKTFPQLNLNYHDYRDASIDNLLPAVESLARRGYFVVRMGAIVRNPIAVRHLRVIDYATNGRRSDFMDIYLGARCEFFLGAAGGLNAIPRVFRRPIAFTNLVPLSMDHLLGTAGMNNLFIPKKILARSVGRAMTFREGLDAGAGQLLRSEEYDARDLDVVENTPEEIAALVDEMEERLIGTWRSTDEDDELQRRFWSLFPVTQLADTGQLRIGADFLRCHRHLLD